MALRFILFLFCWSWLSIATADSGLTLAAADLKKSPFTDAETVATLPNNTPVEVLKRQGGWVQIKSGKDQGWLRLLNIRSGTSKPATGENGLSALLGVGRTSTSATTTTAVRGLSEVDLKQAHPNPAELKKLDQFSASASDAQKFAVNGNLSSRPIEYAPADKNGRADNDNTETSSWGDSK